MVVTNELKKQYNDFKKLRRWNVNSSIEKLKEHIEILIKMPLKENFSVKYTYTPWVRQIEVTILKRHERQGKTYTIYLAKIRDKGEEYYDFKELCAKLIEIKE